MKQNESVHWIVGIALLLGSACNEHAGVRDSANVQNALTQSKYEDLAVAEGTWKGTLRMTKTGNIYPGTLRIKRILETVRGDLPTETILVAKLTANLSFDSLLDNVFSDCKKYVDLCEATGVGATVTIDAGDVNQGMMSLPYALNGYTGNYGSLNGTVLGNHFKGTWTAKPVGEAAEFEFVRIN